MKINEFSKWAVVALTVTWAATALYGFFWLWFRGGESGFDSLLVFVGAPMTGGLLGYLCKAGFENVRKIEGNGKEQDASPVAQHDTEERNGHAFRYCPQEGYGVPIHREDRSLRRGDEDGGQDMD